jgi:hypothetical protein
MSVCSDIVSGFSDFLLEDADFFSNSPISSGSWVPLERTFGSAAVSREKSKSPTALTINLDLFAIY